MRPLAVVFGTGFEAMDWLVTFAPMLRDSQLVPFKRANAWVVEAHIDLEFVPSFGDADDDDEPVVWL